MDGGGEGCEGWVEGERDVRNMYGGGEGDEIWIKGEGERDSKRWERDM